MTVDSRVETNTASAQTPGRLHEQC